MNRIGERISSLLVTASGRGSRVMENYSTESTPSKPSHIRIRPTFRCGERIATAEELKAATEKVRVRQEAIQRYLQVRRELEGYVAHCDIYRLTNSLLYAEPDQASLYEKALMRITRTIAKDFGIGCIKAQRKSAIPTKLIARAQSKKASVGNRSLR